MASHQQLNSVPIKSMEKLLQTFMTVELGFCCFLPHNFFHTLSAILEEPGQFRNSCIQHTSVFTTQLTEHCRKLLKMQETLHSGSLQAQHGRSMPDITPIGIFILFLSTSQILPSLVGLSIKVRHFFPRDVTFGKSVEIPYFFLRLFLVIVRELNQSKSGII